MSRCVLNEKHGVQDTGAVQKTANVTITISVQQAQGPYFINAPITLTTPENSPLVGIVNDTAISR
jgi:hypothetical protein